MTLARVENFLAHYSSEYYDPVKAHEYYLRTRELKGRQSTKGMTEQQRQGWSYAKKQIAERQKADVAGASESRKQAVERLRETAQARREEISGKLRSLLETISAQRSEAAEAISADQETALTKLVADQKAQSAEIREAAARKIAALPPIPKGVSDEQRAKLVARRAEQIAEVNGSAWTDMVKLAVQGYDDRNAILTETENKRTALTEATKQQQEQVRAEAVSSREIVSASLKAAVEKARADYEARREQTKAEYEATAQREYDAIRTRV